MSADTDRSQFGAGAVVACTCGRGDDPNLEHDERCRGSVAVAARLDGIASRGVTTGVLTEAERDLIGGVADLIRHRRGERGGVDHSIDLAELGLYVIGRAAAKICGEEADQ